MGAWGAGVFENDSALDWFDVLEHRGAEAVLIALQAVPGEDDYIDADVASQALAAAKGRPAADLPGEATDWVQAHGAEIGDELAQLAIDAVTRIRTDSELKELWEEGAYASEWHGVADDLLGRLKAA